MAVVASLLRGLTVSARRLDKQIFSDRLFVVTVRLWGAHAADGFARALGDRGALYFSGPRNNNSQCDWCRTHMAVLASDNDGATWSVPVSVWRSEAAYSVLLGLKGGGIGLMYERGSTADHCASLTSLLSCAIRSVSKGAAVGADHNITFAKISAVTV